MANARTRSNLYHVFWHGQSKIIHPKLLYWKKYFPVITRIFLEYQIHTNHPHQYLRCPWVNFCAFWHKTYVALTSDKGREAKSFFFGIRIQAFTASSRDEPPWIWPSKNFFFTAAKSPGAYSTRFGVSESAVDTFTSFTCAGPLLRFFFFTFVRSLGRPAAPASSPFSSSHLKAFLYWEFWANGSVFGAFKASRTLDDNQATQTIHFSIYWTSLNCCQIVRWYILTSNMQR